MKKLKTGGTSKHNDLKKQIYNTGRTPYEYKKESEKPNVKKTLKKVDILPKFIYQLSLFDSILHPKNQ